MAIFVCKLDRMDSVSICEAAFKDTWPSVVRELHGRSILSIIRTQEGKIVNKRNLQVVESNFSRTLLQEHMLASMKTSCSQIFPYSTNSQ